MSKPLNATISVVTPTLYRHEQVRELIANLTNQTILPTELLLIDGAPAVDTATEQIVATLMHLTPFPIRYIRHGGGTAIQRNVGIDHASGEFVAFIDDDIRLESDFFAHILQVFADDVNCQVGGVAGYITNQYLNPHLSPRWRWYRRLKLFTTYEPGRYDFVTGYPINRYLQSPHTMIRPIDFMGSNCAVWRRQVFAAGLRFDSFFWGHGVLEDAHLALRAGKQWTLLECGRAHCLHLHTPSGRESTRQTAVKTATNYRYVFVDIVPHRSWRQEYRFWRVQFVDLFRLFAYALFTREPGRWGTVLGKIEGIIKAIRI